MRTAEYDSDDSLEELRSHLTWRTALILIVFGILGAWYMLLRRDVSMSASGLLCLVVLLGRVVQIVMRKNPALACHLLIWGLLAHLSAAMLLFPNPWLPYLGILCVFVSALLIKNGGFLTATLIA